MRKREEVGWVPHTKGARLKAWLVDHQMRSAELARRIGCARQLIHNIASGQRTPSLKTAVAIERLTGIPCAHWVDG